MQINGTEKKQKQNPVHTAIQSLAYGQKHTGGKIACLVKGGGKWDIHRHNTESRPLYLTMH